jgi:hypothetical protein
MFETCDEAWRRWRETVRADTRQSAFWARNAELPAI